MTEEYATHTASGGQRTWTVMVYLNAVERGGETLFRRLGRSFTPVPGMALAWNNLHADGTPNHFTLHEALPVERFLFIGSLCTFKPYWLWRLRRV